MRTVIVVLVALAIPVVAGPASAESGLASYYHEPQPLACGGRLKVGSMEAAHKTLPCGTRVAVTAGSVTITVTITDRGPYIRGRVIDLTPAAFRLLAPLSRGVVPVSIRVLR